jgi:DegV family protein with EDD domain
MKKEFGILIDSAACCDETYLKTNDIHIVPLSLSDSNNKVYEDNGIDLPRDILLSRMDNNESFKTSATPLGKLTVIVEDMLDVYEKVIFVPISEGLSSQYQQSMIIKADHPNNFFVVKSSSAGAATEFLLPHLIGWLKDKIPMEQILNKAEEFYYHTNTYFSCEDMRSMIKGGRVSNAILKIIN